MWQAVREIVCNAIDENGVIQQIKEVAPVEGETHVYVDGLNDKVKDVIDNWDSYFALNREEIYSTDHGKMYPSLSKYVNIYKKDIRSYDGNCPSLFDYNLNFGSLGEDRILPYYETLYYVSKLYNDAPVDILLKFFKIWEASEYDLFERSISGEYINPGRNWVKALEGKQVLAHEYAGHYPEIAASPTAVLLPIKIVNSLIRRYPDEIEFVTREINVYNDYALIEGTPRQKAMISTCTDFLRKSCLYTGERIKIGIFKKDVKVIHIDEGDLIIPTKLFNLGTKILASQMLTALIYLHGENTLSVELVSLLEEKYNLYL